MPDQRKAMVSSDMISLAQNCLPIFGGSKLRSTPSCLAPHTYVVNTPRLGERIWYRTDRVEYAGARYASPLEC